MTDQTQTTTEPVAFTQYRRSQIAELRPYVPGEPAGLLYRVSISQADLDGGSPKDGDMIARNPANHDDQWLVAADYFAANFEPRTTPQPLAIGLDREAVARVVEGFDDLVSYVDDSGVVYGAEDVDALIERLRSLLALAAPAEGWQGIETHDGSGNHVLIAEGDGSVCEARLLDDGRGWWERNNDPTDAWGSECYPTHWMPLPAAPTGETGA